MRCWWHAAARLRSQSGKAVEMGSLGAGVELEEQFARHAIQEEKRTEEKCEPRATWSSRGPVAGAYYPRAGAQIQGTGSRRKGWAWEWDALLRARRA